MTDSPAEPQPQPPSTGRAGRDLVSAILVGLALAVFLVLLPLIFAPWLFSVIVSVALVVAAHEMWGALAQRGYHLVRVPVYAGVALTVQAAYWFGTPAFIATVGAFVLLVLGWRLLSGPEGYVGDVGASLLVLGYIALMGGFVGLMLASSQGGARAIAFVALTVCSDIGGYAAGVLVGRHPIAPKLSPKKSWEGFAGSVVLQVVVGVSLFITVFDAPWWQGAITGVVLTVTATAGDFVESAIKRDLGVKDMSNLLPGHGGLMDRLDSLLPNAFMSWLLLRVFLGP